MERDVDLREGGMRVDIREVIEGLNLIDNVIVDYVSGRRKGFTDDETERLVYKAVTQAIELLKA